MAQPQIRLRADGGARHSSEDLKSKPLVLTSPVSKSVLKKTSSQAVTITPSTSVRSITSVPQKITWISTPLTTRKENNAYLDIVFGKAPMVGPHGAYRGMWWVPVAFVVTAGVVLPYILWGR